MKQTSMTMLQSWRANCDVQVILYDQDPLNVDCKDIAGVSGYVTSYCTKGNSSFHSEREAIAAMILSIESQSLYGDVMETISLTKKILNNFVGQRIISKAEASCYMLNLPLYECTETFEAVSLSSYKKVLKSHRSQPRNNNNSKQSHIARYSTRSETHMHLSLHDFVEKEVNKKNKNGNIVIPYATGFGGYPTFPISSSYAKSALLMHKPWSKDNHPSYMNGTREEMITAFHQFIESNECPITLAMSFEIARENHNRRLREKECANDEDINPYAPDENTTDISHELLFACRAFHRSARHENLNRGLDFNWHTHNIDIHDKNNVADSWLQQQIDDWKNNGEPASRRDNSRFDITILNGNKEQTEIVYQTLKKLKEWIEFPSQNETHNNQTFQPLLMTIQGAGGTGKSTIIHIISRLISDLIPQAKVTMVTAPTGSAAFNVGGRTCHSFFKIDINDPNKELTENKRQSLEKRMARLLCLIFDERSLLSIDVLGASERHCRECAHKGRNKNKPWGGIPIILLFGDDHQLMSVQIGSNGHGAASGIFDNSGRKRTSYNNPTQLNGAQTFLTMGKKVIELQKCHRIENNEKDLKEICQAMRDNGGLDYDQADTLLSRHISSSTISENDRRMLSKEAIWIYHSNKDVDRHNYEKMVELVSSDNPVITVQGTYEPALKNSNGVVRKKHFQRQVQKYSTCTFTRGCRVALTRNIWPEKGLYNGSMGTIKDVRYRNGETPLNGHEPQYVIVEFNDYTGPAWSLKYPTCIPLTMSTIPCEHKCCNLRSLPLTLSFARTLHKFQGQQVGPNFPIKYIVFDCGSSRVEASNPGFAYTGISRAATMDSLFFTGELNDARLMDLTKKRNKGQATYEKVKRRQHWMNYLKSNKVNAEEHISSQEQKELLDWKNSTTLTLHELDNLIESHGTSNNV